MDLRILIHLVAGLQDSGSSATLPAFHLVLRDFAAALGHVVAVCALKVGVAVQLLLPGLYCRRFPRFRAVAAADAWGEEIVRQRP